MSTYSLLEASGLVAAPNRLSAVPRGALSVADNVVIKHPNLIEPRRGVSAQSFGSSNDRALSIGFFQGGRIVNYSSGASTAEGTGRLAYSTDGSNWSNTSGTYDSVDSESIRMRFVEAMECLWFNTSVGLQVLETLNGTPTSAGVVQAWDARHALVSGVTVTGTGAWMPNNSQVAYRVVWGKEDAYERVILGAPSGRFYVPNGTGSTVFPIIWVPVPDGVTSSNFFRLYRTRLSASATSVPNDEFYLVYEGTCPADITIALGAASVSGTTVTVTHASHGYHVGMNVHIAGNSPNFDEGYFVLTAVTSNTFTYTQTTSATAVSSATMACEVINLYVPDYTAEAALSTPLYTNPASGDVDGDAYGNYRAPIAKDVTLWQERMWFANTVSKHRLNLELIGTGLPEGLQANDTITIAGTIYTAKASPSAVGEFELVTSSTASENVRLTMQSLVHVINHHPSNDEVVAFNTSSLGGSSGSCVIEAVELGADAFEVYASRTNAWFPRLTTGSSGAVTSKNDAAVNRLWWSHENQPEAVPLLNYRDVGAKNKAILRIIPQRGRLFVFKEDGLFIVSGLAPNIRIDLVDPNLRLVGANTACPFDDRVVCFSNRGVVAVSESGALPLSKAIDDDLSRLTSNFYTKKWSWGAAYESERLYLFGVTTTSGSFPSTIYVFNGNTGAWTEWPLSHIFGAVDPSTDKLQLCSSAANQVHVERKSDSLADAENDFYFDSLGYTTTISSVTSTNTIVVASASNINVGDYVSTGSGGAGEGLVSAKNGTTITVNLRTGNFTGASSGSLGIRSAIPVSVEWAPIHAGAPGTLKRFSEATLHFQGLNVSRYSASLATDHNRSQTDTSLVGRNFVYWSDTVVEENQRFLIPLEKQRGSYIRIGVDIREAYGVFALAGVSLEWDSSSQRGSK